MACELVRRHIRTCSSIFDVKTENLDVGDYNISETITTTETRVAPFGSVTLPVGQKENETQISLTVSEIFDRGQEPWTRCFFIMAGELVRRHIRVCSSEIGKLLMFTIHNDYNISETITTTETRVAPFCSVTLAPTQKWKRNSNISYRFGDIRPGQEPWTRCFFILIIIVMACELVRRHIRVCSSKIGKLLMLATTISQKR